MARYGSSQAVHEAQEKYKNREAAAYAHDAVKYARRGYCVAAVEAWSTALYAAGGANAARSGASPMGVPLNDAVRRSVRLGSIMYRAREAVMRSCIRKGRRG